MGPWPECIGMTGEEAVRYIQSQNRDLSVEVVHSVVNDYYCATAVRFSVDENGIVREAPERG